MQISARVAREDNKSGEVMSFFSVPKYVLLYFPDSAFVKVECSDIIRREHRRIDFQVHSRQELENEDGHVEVCLPSRIRNGNDKVLPAKILLFGDVFKDLVIKRDAFKRGEDIWKTTSSPAICGPKVASVAVKKITSATQKASAIAMGETLKRDLKAQRESDSDNTDIDLFDNTEQRRSRKRPWLLDSEDEQHQHEDESIVQKKAPESPAMQVQLDSDVVKALKELPGIVASLKDVFQAMRQSSFDSSSSSPNSSELCTPRCSEMITLADSDVVVPKRIFDRLNRTRMSLFTQELAMLIFGKETLAKSTLTGKYGTDMAKKDQLDPHKVDVLIDTVLRQFPNASVPEVRVLIRRKCNNEAYSKKSFPPLEG